MAKPITPLVGCDVFVTDEKGRILLIKRADNGYWGLPGGCQNLSETPREAAERECQEETGFKVEATTLLGVFSSKCYPYEVYPWKDNEFCHIFFAARVVSGSLQCSDETPEVGWFDLHKLPPLSDGNLPRIEFGFRWLEGREKLAHFE